MGNRGSRTVNTRRVEQKEIPIIKSYNNIKKETICLKKTYKESDDIYSLGFNFSCTSDALITIYLCCTEFRSKDPSCPPVYFHTPDYVPVRPMSYKFSEGNKQTFPERAFTIDFSKFSEEDVNSYIEGEYYPIIITIEADYPQPIRNDLRFYRENKRQAQITYGYFMKNSSGEYNFLISKQCFLFRDKIFRVEDIYGFEKHDDTGVEVFDDSQKECVICYSNIKDTIVYPCRHICLCAQCTQVVRMQNSKCPICRAQADKFITVNVIKDCISSPGEDEGFIPRINS